MTFKSRFSTTLVALGLLLSVSARAGIPTIDNANLAQAVQNINAWALQAQQMVNQINQLQQQLTQLQAMTSKLEGVRNLGTILSNPNIQSALPLEMRDSAQLLLNPAGLASSISTINQIRSSFGVQTTGNPAAGQSAADALGRVQQIQSASQLRGNQLQQLASRVDSTIDAKDSLDMVNRNVLESANINNQMMQTMASLEAARQAAELKRIADNQAYFARMRAAAQQQLRDLSY